MGLAFFFFFNYFIQSEVAYIYLESLGGQTVEFKVKIQITISFILNVL